MTRIQGETLHEAIRIEAACFGVDSAGHIHFDVDRYDKNTIGQNPWNSTGHTDGVALYLTPKNARKLARKLLKLAQ